MKRLLPWLLCVVHASAAVAQEEAAPSGRVLEEEAPAPPAEAAPPAADDDTSRQVMGADNANKPRRAPPPRPAPKPTAKVMRDKDGKVVVPRAPEPLTDPLSPKTSGMNGVDRAWLTAQQALSGVLVGSPGILCTACACPPLLCVSTLNPLIGLVVMGGFFAVMAPLYVVSTSVGLFLPAQLQDRDLVSAAVAGAVVLGVDALALVLGGITSMAVLLRWSPSPSSPFGPLRGPPDVVGSAPPVPQMTGTTFALLLNLLAASSVALFVAPLLGTAAYTAVVLLRPEREPSVETPAQDTPRPTRKRRVRRAS